MMEFTAEMIAGFLGGEIVGNKEAKVHTVSSIEEGKAGSLSYLTNPKYEAYIYTTGASVVLVNRTFEPAQPLSATLIKVDDAGACVLKLLEMYNAAKPRRSGISPRFLMTDMNPPQSAVFPNSLVYLIQAIACHGVYTSYACFFQRIH